MRLFLVVSIIFTFPFSFVAPSASQTSEEGKAATDFNNQFLNRGSYEQLNLLQGYYQQIFSQQGKLNASRLGAEADRDPTRLFSQTTPGLEGPIDPTEYIIGPFDVLDVNVWGMAPIRFWVPVTPEGTLIIPTVGEITVAGDTLAAVKKKIQQAMRKKYTVGDIGVTLSSMRTFKVTVAGAVSTPGAYSMTSVDRVDRVVYMANLNVKTSPPEPVTPPPTQLRQNGEKPPPLISLRNIKLFRANGDTITVDLVRYYASGETSYNPYLRDGDVVFVPAENLPGNSVSIYGGVRMPGSFEFHAGDSLRTLVQIGQGPTALADLDHVEVARFLADGRQAQTIIVNLRAIQEGEAPDIALHRNDRIFLRENPETRKERTVFVKGAVHKPGAYAILHDFTTLSEIIERAGGFMPEASIAESKLIRRYGNPDEMYDNPDYERLIDIRLSDLRPADREYFNYEAAIKRGFVSVDFLKLFNHHEKSADVYVWEGDEIYVPSMRYTVNVFGQVINPGYVSYLGGMDYRYYIEKAGGFSKEANLSKVRVVKRDTKAWVIPGDAIIEPGDQIFVPRVQRRPASAYFNAFRDILQITVGVATVVLLVDQARRGN
jgi:protein involved in polysaccharide export with SLBB domain